MPALDNCLPQVANALRKDGWVIDPNPLFMKIRKRRFFIDILARRQAQPLEQIAVIEAKCFSLSYPQQDQLYSAIGQYLVYRDGLRTRNLSDLLYLAVPTHAYHGIFKDIAMNVVREVHMKLLVYDMSKEEIVTWLR